MTQAESFALLAAMTMVNVAGTISITFAAKGHGLQHLALGGALYLLGALMMYRLVESGGEIGMWGPVSAIAGLMLVTISGNLLFSEVITQVRALGLMLAAAAIFLIALGAAEARS